MPFSNLFPCYFSLCHLEERINKDWDVKYEPSFMNYDAYILSRFFNKEQVDLTRAFVEFKKYQQQDYDWFDDGGTNKIN